MSFGRPADELLLDPATVITPLVLERLTVVGIEADVLLRDRAAATVCPLPGADVR